MGAPGRVLEAELDDVVALFGECGAGRSAGQTGADDDDGVFAPVGGVHEFRLEAAGVPAFGDGAVGGLRVGEGLARAVLRVVGHVSSPLRS